MYGLNLLMMLLAQLSKIIKERIIQSMLDTKEEYGAITKLNLD